MKGNSMSRSLEDYLEAILNLSKREGSARVTDLAAALGVSKPSVNQAVATLADNGYINYAKYEPITLTELGRAKAAGVLRVHRLVRVFLIDVLGVSPEIAEHDACAIEHVLSEQTIDKLAEFLDGINR